MTKTIKETWKEEIYEIITHNETSECHLKLVVLVESLISQVEALVRREVVEETVATLEKREAVLQELVDKYNLDIDRHRLMEVQSIRIPLQAQIKEIEEKV